MFSVLEKKITVIHACQWQIMRDGVRNHVGIKEDIEFIGEAKNGKELLELLTHKSPDVILLDIYMPIMNGLETLPILKEKYPDIRVVILTMYDDPSLIIKLLELGVNGYLTMESSADDIYDAIIYSIRPGIYLNVGVSHARTLSFDRLSAKEIKIIKALALNRSLESIGQELDLSSRTVAAIIDKLKRMGNVSTPEEIIALARKKGYIEDEVVP